MDIVWNKYFEDYKDFIHKNKRYPKNNKNDDIENKLFNWIKYQKTLITKNKLDDLKIKKLKSFEYWYSDYKTKKNNINKMKEFNNDHIIINIENKDDNDYQNNYQNNYQIINNNNYNFLYNLIYKFIKKPLISIV